MNPSLAQVEAIVSHVETCLLKPYDSYVLSEPVLDLQPAAILDSMVETGHDYWADGPGKYFFKVSASMCCFGILAKP